INSKSTCVVAILYTRSRWEVLTRFLDDGLIEIISSPAPTVGRAVGSHCLARRNLQNERRRSAILLTRRALKDRRAPSHGSDRRAAAVRLCAGGREGCGLKTPLTLERLIENGIPTETLVAHVLVAKMPITRRSIVKRK